MLYPTAEAAAVTVPPALHAGYSLGPSITTFMGKLILNPSASISKIKDKIPSPKLAIYSPFLNKES